MLLEKKTAVITGCLKGIGFEAMRLFASEGADIPEVLLSGHHGRVAAWRRAEAERLTRERRPDLWARYRENHEKTALSGPSGKVHTDPASKG